MPPKRRPFHRIPFSTLDEKPHRPHRYFETRAEDVELESAAFGRMRVHVRQWGEGPPLLLIHGLMTSSYSWRYTLDGLGAHFRLIIPDLPGAGLSDKPDRPYSADALSAFIGEFQAALGLRGCLAVGNSLGGYLCMRRALDDNGAFSRLCNIHSPAFPLGRLYALAGALAVPGAARLLGWWIRRAPLKWAHANVHYYDETLKSLEEARAYGDPLASDEGVRAFVRYLSETMAPRDFAGFIAALERRRRDGNRFPMPLMLLYSRQDPLVPPSIGERLHGLVPDARMEWLQESSHFAHVDSPARVVPLLLDFLRG
jgi:pimeloyl-ACP methyl ester carboxylesterase